MTSILTRYLSNRYESLKPELRNGIGWVIIGGMTVSTMLTLVVVPVVYKIFNRKKAGKA